MEFSALILFLILSLIGFGIYFLPFFIGHKKRNGGAIFVLNLCLGWTLIGWVVALVWACCQEDKPL
jgi:hypothetical protein